jgi:hypothetical protein
MHTNKQVKKCAMCASTAVVQVSWPVSSGEQSHKVCDPCAHSLWDRLSSTYNGTEAFLGVSIAPLENN